MSFPTLQCLLHLHFCTPSHSTYLVIFWLIIFVSFSSSIWEPLKNRGSDIPVISIVLSPWMLLDAQQIYIKSIKEWLMDDCKSDWVTMSLVVQSMSSVWLFATPWTAARQASLSITNSQSLPKLVSISDAIQPSHSLSSPSPPASDPSQHQSLFQWVSSSHQLAKVLELQLQHQSFQWIFRIDFL